MIARRIGLLQLGIGDLDAVLDQILDLLADELAAHLGLEAPGLEPHLLEDAEIAVAREPAVLLELPHLLDAGAQLVVADPHPFATGGLHDHRVVDQLVHHPLVEPEPLDHLGRQPLPGHALVLLDEIGLCPPEALGGDLLPVDGADDVGRAPVAAIPVPK